MTKELALFPTLLELKGDTLKNNLILIVVGVLLITLLARLSFSLPWTLVPITGQTFGVILISLLWGRLRGFCTVACYLLLGSLGFPIFSVIKANIFISPTSGYLLGMLIGSYVMGQLSDHGWCQRLWSTYLVTVIGNIIIYFFGAAILSLFIPKEQILMSGVIPFIPGDIVKSILASQISFKANQEIKNIIRK